MDIVKKHSSIVKVIVVILLTLSLFFLFGSQLYYQDDVYTYQEVFFKGNDIITSSPIGFIGYLLFILPLILEVTSLLLSLSKNNDYYKNDILATDIASIIFIIPAIVLISLMPYFSNAHTSLGAFPILVIIMASISILILIYLVTMDILAVRALSKGTYDNLVTKYNNLCIRFMNIFRGYRSITMISGGVLTLTSFSMAFLPQVELEDGTSFTVLELYREAFSNGSVFPFFILIAYPILLISALIMIIAPIRTFLKRNKGNPEKKKIPMWIYVTVIILSLVSIICVGLFSRVVEGSSLTAYAITMISLASSGLVIAARKLVLAIVLSIPRFVVNDLPRLKSWLNEVDLRNFTIASLVVSIIGVFIILIPITDVSLYISIGILIVGLIVSIVINSLLYKREKRMTGNIINLTVNSTTLILSLVMEFIVLGIRELSIALLLLDIATFIVILICVSAICLEINRNKKKKKMDLSLSSS
ncbi:MAG: hypothetical protein LUD22_04125 [Coprobacillus sp.]|nr:hypothetical protein [Coprobacillus sp.]